MPHTASLYGFFYVGLNSKLFSYMSSILQMREMSFNEVENE